MKKGESIRLEIREVKSEGLVLYSYKKKAEIFLDTTQLKTSFSKEKYQKFIGSPIVLRLISTRPELRVSEKFIHKDAPVFDDYSLRPKEDNSADMGATEEITESTSVQKMIRDKEIIITKENQFNKGWTLFHSFDLGVADNRFYRETMFSDVIRLITRSDEVNLILYKPCLSSRIVSEIEWANKYIKLNVIAKDESILNRYSNLVFSTKIIDKNIDFNYVGITGKESGYFIISEGYIKTDDSIDGVYFRKQDCKKDYSFLDKTDSIIIIDKDGDWDYEELIKATKKTGVKCYYAVNTAFYERKIFNMAQKESLNLLVSNFTVNGVILVNKDKTLECLVDSKKNFFITYQIQKVSSFLGKEYSCGFYADTVDTKTLSGEIYTCYNGELKKLDIADKKIIRIDVPIKEMSDFMSEKFDSSAVEQHNLYSAEAVNVEYRFTLIPPLFDESYSESKIYEPVHTLCKKWKGLQRLDIERIKSDYNAFLQEDFGIVDFLDSSVSFTETLTKAVKGCAYTGYYTWLKATADLYCYYNEKLLDVCKNMFNAINEESFGTKFNKFDDEIAGYEQTIKEKEALIKQGKDILSNKRRVEILTQKIADLQELKKRFENNSETRNDKTLNIFIAHCNEVMSNNTHVVTNDSIGTIVKPKEETKTARLESFVDNHLFAIKQYIVNCIELLDKLAAVQIPENYTVYDKNGEKFIVINELDEYEKTKFLREKFTLKCITRR